MSTTLTTPIPAEANAAAISAHTLTVPPVADAPDTVPTAPSSPKLDDFCTRYAHLIAEYGEPVAFSDKGNMSINEMLFAAKFAQDQNVLFSPEENRFYFYSATTGLWSHLTDGALRLMVHRDVFAAAKGEGVEAEMAFKLTDRQLRSLASHIEGQTEKRNAFDGAHGLIHTKNGMLDLSTGKAELKPFDADYRSRNQVPVAYNPAATCPRFINELLKPALTDDDIDLLQRIAGSILLGGNRAQRIVLITGLAGGGKSTIVSVFESIIGPHNIAGLRPSLLAESRFELSRFIGKTTLVGKDVRSDFLSDKAVSHLKSLTGGDRMTAELKGSNEVVPLRGNFSIIVTANATPRLTLDNDADAWRRRLLVLPFNGKKPAKPIPDFAGVLIREEGEAILNWMVEGAIRHLAELESHGGFVLTDAQQARIDSMLAESNSIDEFVKACVVSDPIRDVTSDELLGAYEQYCVKQDWTGVSSQAFRTKVKHVMLERHGVTQSHDVIRFETAVRGFRKVSLKVGVSTTPPILIDRKKAMDELGF